MVSQPRVIIVRMLGGSEGRRAAHLFLTDILRLMTQYVRYSNMTDSGCFLLVFFTSWGTIYFIWISSPLLESYLFFLNYFFLPCPTCSNNCGQCGASTSCEEVPNCNTSETEAFVSHPRCCCCSSGETQTTASVYIYIF